MEYGISHNVEDETMEAKARWYLEKPLEERLREALEGIIFIQKIRIFEPPDDRSTFKSVCILERPRR